MTDNYYGGSPLLRQPPERHPLSKWYVPESMWPEEFYRPYVSGAGILLSRYSAKQMEKVLHRVPYLSNEDAYVGVLAYENNITVSAIGTNYLKVSKKYKFLIIELS